MNGRLLINGTDAFTAYGLYIKDGDVGALLRWPKFRESSIATNDWQEEDGIEADLSAPVLDSREVELSFYRTSSNAVGFPELYNLLTEQTYNSFYFKSLDRTYQLRVVSNQSFAWNNRFDSFVIRFADDMVSVPTYDGAWPGGGYRLGYTLDGVDFADFGVIITEGSREALFKAAKVKEALKRSTIAQSGVRYDDAAPITRRPESVTLNMHIRAISSEEFWREWNALWSVILAPNERTIGGKGFTLSAYYGGCSMKKYVVLLDGSIWVDFAVTFNVLRSTYTPPSPEEDEVGFPYSFPMTFRQ